MDTGDTGYLAERAVALFLEKKGYQLMDHNWRRPWGELDIIARVDGTVVFVEVKASGIDVPGFEPELRADRAKIAKVVRTARTYLREKNYPEDTPWRIDIISVVFNRWKGSAKITHFKNIENEVLG